MVWFLYDNGLRHERVKLTFSVIFDEVFQFRSVNTTKITEKILIMRTELTLRRWQKVSQQPIQKVSKEHQIL